MELLAPSGNIETFYTALNSGADAIYIGGKAFSARAYASNFSDEEVKECIKEAHLRNVKVYITVNTLLFEDELEVCLNQCKKYIEYGVDAFIVQDLGLVSLLRRAFPDFPLHASTQLNVHNIDEANKLKKIGITRVVLARETPLKVVKEIIDKTHLEVEVFVHGALCVSQSGQCLMSSFIGNRSGNRGRCAQPCRMKGKLVSTSFSKSGYMLSTKELCTLPYIDELKKAGVVSLKIEGRMKGIEYLYITVSYYRKKLDGESFNIDEAYKDLKLVFNRDFTKGFINNESQTCLLNQNSSSHQGIYLGKVSKVTEKSFFMVLKEDLSLHDGLKLSYKEDGFLITHFKVKGKDVHFASKGEYVEIISKLKNVKVGDVILKTKSSIIEENAINVLKTNKKLPVNGYFTSSESGMSFTLLQGELSYTAYINEKIEKSKNSFTSKQDLFNRLSKSDTYPFELVQLEYDIVPGLFYPIKLLNELRREAYLGLYNLKLDDKKIYFEKEIKPYYLNKGNAKKDIICIVEKEEQLKVVLNYPISKIYVNSVHLFEKYKGIDNRIHYSQKRFLEKNNFKNSLTHYISLNGETMSSYGNVTNSEAVSLLFNEGYSSIVLSYEVSLNNALKIYEKFKNVYGFEPNLYYPIYGYIELMLLKSCPIATCFNKKDIHCSLCHKEQVYYEDRIGVKYPIYGDENCITKILSDKPLSLISKKERINKYFGLCLTFTIENNYQTENVLDALFNKEFENYDYFEGHYTSSPE